VAWPAKNSCLTRPGGRPPAAVLVQPTPTPHASDRLGNRSVALKFIGGCGGASAAAHVAALRLLGEVAGGAATSSPTATPRRWTGCAACLAPSRAAGTGTAGATGSAAAGVTGCRVWPAANRNQPETLSGTGKPENAPAGEEKQALIVSNGAGASGDRRFLELVSPLTPLRVGLHRTAARRRPPALKRPGPKPGTEDSR
jgi:hypothetical protein